MGTRLNTMHRMRTEWSGCSRVVREAENRPLRTAFTKSVKDEMRSCGWAGLGLSLWIWNNKDRRKNRSRRTICVFLKPR